MFYSVGIFRVSRLRDNISSNTERTAPRRWRWGGEVRLYRSLQQRASSLNIKWLLLVKENQISQVKEFRAFLCMGRCESLGELLLLLSRFSRVRLCAPGSAIPGILLARRLEWVAISFSNAWKWKLKVKSLSRVRLFAIPWTAAYQAPPSMGFSRQEYWNGMPLPSPKSFLSYASQLSGASILCFSHPLISLVHIVGSDCSLIATR